MIPFPGESIGIRRTYPLPVIDDIYQRELSTTISSGTEWRIWVRGTDSTYLEDAGTPVVASWVVEVLSGSGTLTFHEGTDATGTDAGAPVPTDLGTRSVSGAGTVVVTSTFTAADVMLATPQMVLALACTSGSVEVQQVKLRVWPTAGPLGGWSDIQPGFSTTPGLPQITGATVARDTVEGPVASPPEAAWDAAMTLLAAVGSTGGAGPHPITTGTVSFVNVGGTSWAAAAPSTPPVIGLTASIDTTTAQVRGTPTGLAVVLTGLNPATANPIEDTLEEEVDYIRPPTEVPTDDQWFVQQIGTAEAAWVNATATLKLLAGAEPVNGGPTVSSVSPTTSPVVGSTIDLDLVEGPAEIILDTADVITGVPLAATGQFVGVTVSHSMTTVPAEWPSLPPFAGELTISFTYALHFGVGTLDSSFAPMMSYLIMPPYRVWDPTVVRRIPLRQFHRDDGLGVVPPRAFGGASRDRTGRAFGYD